MGYFLFGFCFFEGLFGYDFDCVLFFGLKVLDLIAFGKSSLTQKSLLGVFANDYVTDLAILFFDDLSLESGLLLLIHYDSSMK